jgi:hypothetical protein
MKILQDNTEVFGSYRNVPWYIEDKNEAEELASKLGFTKFQRGEGVEKKKQFCRWGGFMFAMCSATDSFDIALAADGVDIVNRCFGDPSDANYQSSMNYGNSFAFKDFILERKPEKI